MCRLGLSQWFLLGSGHVCLISLMSRLFLSYSVGFKFAFQPCFAFFPSCLGLLDPDAWPPPFCFSDVYLCMWALQETHRPCLLPVNSFGDDGELCTSSDTDEEVIKQFEISVSRSQSFRSRASEKGKHTGPEQKPKVRRLLSASEEDGAHVSACEGILCIRPFLSPDQGRPMGRTSLSHLTSALAPESPERERKWGRTQRRGQGKGARTLLAPSCGELGEGTHQEC